MTFLQEFLVQSMDVAVLASVAAAALALCLIAIIVDRVLVFRRASPALRHSFLVTTPILLLALPVFVGAMHHRGWGHSVGWLDSQKVTHSAAITEQHVSQVTPSIDSPLPPHDVSSDSHAKDDIPRQDPKPSFISPVTANRFTAPVMKSAISDAPVEVFDSWNPPPSAASTVVHSNARSIPTSQEPRVDVRTLASTSLAAIWLAGSIVAAIRFGRGCHRLRRLLKTTSPVTDPELCRLVDQLSRHCRRTPRLYWSEWISSPMTCGLWKPRIVLPRELMTTWRTEDWTAALTHELAHITRHDLSTALLQRICTIAYWWNVPLYRVHARLDDLREQLCDDAVLQAGIDPQRYARLLVHVATTAADRRLPAAALGLTRIGFKNRVSRLMAKERPMSVRTSWKKRLFLMVLAIVISGGVVRATLMRAAPMDASLIGSITETTEKTTSPSYYDTSEAISLIPPGVDAAERSTVEPAPSVDSAAAELTPAVAPTPAVAEQPLPAEPRPATADSTFIFWGPDSTVDPAAAELTPAAAANQTFLAEPAPTVGFGVSVTSDSFASPTPPMASSDMAAPAADRAGLFLISLLSNEAGELSDIRYFNASLGTGDEALAKLDEHLQRAKEKYPASPFGTVRVEASPNLRYQDVQRVAERLTHAGAEIRFNVANPAQHSEEGEAVIVSVVFVKDAASRKLSSQPVICIREQVVLPENLKASLGVVLPPSRSVNYGLEIPHPSEPFSPRSVAEPLPAESVIINADPEVLPEIIENVVGALNAYGIGDIRLRSTQSDAFKPL